MEANSTNKQLWELVAQFAADFGFSEQSLATLIPMGIYYAGGIFTGILYASVVALFFSSDYFGMFGVYIYCNPTKFYGTLYETYLMLKADMPPKGPRFLELIHVLFQILSYTGTAMFLHLFRFCISYMWSLLTGAAPLTHLAAFWILISASLIWFSTADQPLTRLRVLLVDYIFEPIFFYVIGWIVLVLYYCYSGLFQIWMAFKKLKKPLRLVMWLRRQLLRVPSSFYYPEASSFYEYRPLTTDREIRLLRISRRLPGTDIETKLIHVRLEKAPAYDCISYTWGEGKETRCIFVDNLQFQVSAKVYQILDERASVWSSRLLWIDSICINQTDDEEKSKQVRLMQKVYRAANRVVVCLGGAPDAALARSLIQELVVRIGDIKTAKLDEIILRVYAKEKENDGNDAPPRWLALVRLFSNPWFERTWVVQEMVTASKVLFFYGGRYFDYDNLLFVLLAFARCSPEVTEILRAHTGASSTLLPAQFNGVVMSATRGEFQRGEPVKLFDVLTRCINFKATDPRDKVFALQGLTEGASHNMLILDYTKTTRDVMLNTALYFLTTSESFQVLEFAGIGWDRDIQNLPSWVVDWTQVLPPQSIFHHNWPYPYKAAIGESWKIIPGAELDSIKIEGIHLDNIKKLGVTVGYKQSNELYLSEAIAWMSLWFMEAVQLSRENCPDPYYTEQPLSEALWRTLLGDRTKESRPAPLIFAAHFRKLLDCINGPLMKDKINIVNDEPMSALSYKFTDDELDKMAIHLGENGREAVLEYLKDAFTYLLCATLACGRGRRFAVTREGYLCLVPPGTEPGDMVCLILGAAVPFVLRLLNRSKDNLSEGQHNSYVLVGECYVHGMMDGEIFNHEHDTQVFELY